MSFNWFNNWPYTPSVMPTMIDHTDVINNEYFSGLNTEIKAIEDCIDNQVKKIIAGTNVTISPTSGIGAVTINSSGGGAGGSKPAILLTPGAATLPNTAFAELSKIPGTNWTFWTALFDKDAIESIYFNKAIPEGYAGGNLKVTIYARANATSNTAKMVVVMRFPVSDNVNDAVTTPDTVTVSMDVTAIGTAYDVIIGSGTLSAGLPVAGAMAQIKVYRNATDGGDNLAVDLEVLQIKIEEI